MKHLALLVIAELIAVSSAAANDWKDNGTLTFFVANPPTGFVTNENVFSPNCVPDANSGAWTDNRGASNSFVFTLHQLWSWEKTTYYTGSSNDTYIGQSWGQNLETTRWCHFKVRWIQNKDYQVFDPITQQWDWIRFHKPTSDLTVKAQHQLQFKTKLVLKNWAKDPNHSLSDCWGYMTSWCEGWFDHDQSYMNGPPRWPINHLWNGGIYGQSVTEIQRASTTFGPTTQGWSDFQFLDAGGHWQKYKLFTISASNITQVGTTSDGRLVYEGDLPSQLVTLFLDAQAGLENSKGHFDVDVTASGKVMMSFP